MLRESREPLCVAHDLAVLDLDGVVYIGRDAVPGAPEHLAAARARGLRLAYVTNNASRPPGSVVAHLREIGVEVSESDVVTSAQAAARLLADRLDRGAKVYLIGGEGLDLALREEGLTPVTAARDHPVAVVQGYGPDMPWKQVVAGAILVRDGLPWVASNTDATIPTAGGIGPGNGALVDLVARFSERTPEVAGKPAPPLLQETSRRVGGDRPLMVGDRLDTDIAGGHAVGWPTLLVLTGVTGLSELVCAVPEERPSFIAADLGGLLEAHAVPELRGGTASLGGWQAATVSGVLRVTGRGGAEDWWRVAATAAWDHLDREGTPVATDGVELPDPTALVP